MIQLHEKIFDEVYQVSETVESDSGEVFILGGDDSYH